MPMRRRDFLAVVSSATIATIAGCSTESLDVSGGTPNNSKTPFVPEHHRVGWEKFGETSVDIPASSLSTTAKVKLYEKPELRERVREKLSDDFDAPVAVSFISHANISGTGERLATPRIIADKTEPMIKKQIHDVGLENTEPTPIYGLQPHHPDAKSVTREFITYFDAPEMQPTINRFGFSHTFTIDPTPVPFTVLFDVWKPSSDHVFVAGGVFPRVDTQNPDWATLRGGGDMGWLTGMFMDFIVDPDDIRREVIRIIQNTKLPD